MRLIKSILITLLACTPVAAMAHGGDTGHGLLHGLAHPLGGADHLLAMVAVGFWAWQLGGRARWLVPAAFVAVMIAGGVLGMTGWALPYVEQGVAVSVLLLGMLVAGATRLPLAPSCLLVAVFALFHGNAHGLELPATASAGNYIAGFVLATALLHAAGVATGSLLESRGLRAAAGRLAGVAIAAAGMWMALS